MAAWLGAELPVMPPDEARVELARRWLRSFGPATVADLRWWTGWSAGEVKRALTVIEPVEVTLDGGGAALVLADDVAPVKAPKPWAALLPALDPTAMGWTGRDWYLGPHAGALFDRSGNVGPTVWWCGRIVGGWGQRPDGEVVVRLLEDVGADAATAVAAEADRLARLLDGAVGAAPVPDAARTGAGRYERADRLGGGVHGAQDVGVGRHADAGPGRHRQVAVGQGERRRDVAPEVAVRRRQVGRQREARQRARARLAARPMPVSSMPPHHTGTPLARHTSWMRRASR